MKLKDVRFAHLHAHNHYSLLDGFMSQDAMIERARELDLAGIAETNHGKMYGSYSFYKKARAKTDKKGNPLKPVKPIIGVEAYVSPSEDFIYSRKGKEKRYYHFILLAKNYEGYQELARSTRVSEKRTYRGKPILLDEDLEYFFGNGNIVATSACLGGEIQQYLLEGRYEEAIKKTLYYKKVFNGDFYMELQNHGIKEQMAIINKQLEVAKECGVECIITSDAHFARKEDKKYHDILICMQRDKKLHEYTSDSYTPYHHLMSKGELFDMFKGIIPDEEIIKALNNTGVIADMCNVEFPKKNHYPKYRKLMPGENADDVLRQRAFDNLDTLPRYQKLSEEGRKEYVERLNEELGIIKTTGYSDYFLIVSDVMNHYEEAGGYTGLGRGSVVGSLVSYATGMTKVDPIEHELYFDRFLNLERVSPPDADIDFCHKRKYAFDYTINTYGMNNVCKVITFGTLAARSALRAVGRVYDIPLSYVDKIAKAVTASPGVTLEDCLDKTSEFFSVPLKEFYDNETMAKDLIDTAIMFEGTIKNTSIHAAACIVSDEDLSEYVPLQWDKDSEMWVTQFYKDYNEELGLLKLDYLGLNNLTVIKETVKLVNERHNLQLSHNDIIKMAQEDPEVVSEVYAKGNTKLVFQFESGGMRDTLTSFNPKNLDDLILLNAVYRPGPMQYIPKIVENKNNPSGTHYDHAVLRPILEATYGYPVFQEQIMAIFRTICGYSLGKADIIRRAMGKKKMDELAAARKDFIEGYERLGLSEDRANEFFDEIMEFAKYSFNKSHAAAYTITSLETAYLKLRYPQEYMTASLSYPPKVEAYPEMLEECKEMGIEIYLPDVNYSEELFIPEGDGIRFGLSAIKDVGKGAVDFVKNKPYNSFQHFMDKLSTMKNINKTKVIALAKAGAFDGLGVNRMTAIHNLEFILEASKKSHIKRAMEGQMDLFSMGALDSAEIIKMEEVKEMPYNQKLEMEYESLFAYVSGHPLDEYRAYVKSSEIQFQDIDENADGEEYNVIARIKEYDILYRKKDNKPMAKVILEDFSGNIEAMVFTNEYEEISSHLEKGAVMQFRVKISVEKEVRDEDIIIIKKAFIKGVENLPAINRAVIKVDDVEAIDWSFITERSGSTEIYVFGKKQQSLFPKNFHINITDDVKNYFGEENIVMF